MIITIVLSWLPATYWRSADECARVRAQRYRQAERERQRQTNRDSERQRHRETEKIPLTETQKHI